MKRNILFLIVMLSSFLYAQEVEKLGEIKGLVYMSGLAGGPGDPNGIAVNEVDSVIKIINNTTDYTCYDLNTLKGLGKSEYRDSYVTVQIELNGIDVSYSDSVLIIEKDNQQIQCISGTDKIRSGISFVLKKDNGYIIYYVNEDGFPGAADTDGRVYSNKEAMEYLKRYDPEKYEQGKKISGKLELYNDFIRDRVLIWGTSHYKKHSEMMQYDIQGNCYHLGDYGSLCAVLSCYFNDNCVFYIDDLNPYSEIKNNHEEHYSSRWYVGFGGNIYYYITGEEYTEVFRVRRTWGEPDFYAMAINGYTADSYGNYVDKVLPALSKSDLRLLRNTIFALYGVHFKSTDLSKHFNEQVWYTDEGKSSGEIQLSEHRQKLVEMIQNLEKK